MALEDDHVVADETRLRAAFDHPVDDHTTRDGTHFRHPDDIANLRLPDDDFLERRIEQSEHRIADLLFDFVDNGVQTDVDILLFSHLIGAGFRSHVEPDDDRRSAGRRRIRCARQQDVMLGDRAYARADDAYFDFFGRKLEQGVFEHLDRSLHVGFEYHQQLFYFTRLQ